MRTLHELRSDSVTVRYRSPDGGVALAALPMAVVAALSFGSGSLLAGVVFAALTALLAAAAFPRRQRISVSPDSRLVFDTTDEGEDGSYRVVLEHGERRVPLLEHPEPGVVLADVERIARETGVPVESAWGVPADHFRVPASSARARLEPGRVEGSISPVQRTVTRGSFGAGLFVLLVLGYSAYHAREITALSIVLPLSSVAFVFTFAAWFASRRTAIAIGETGVDVEEWVFGRKQGYHIPADHLLGAYAIGHAGRSPSHVLFESTGGRRVVRLAGEAARRAVEHVESAPGQAESSDPPERPTPTPMQRDAASRHAPATRPARSAGHSRKYPC